MEPDFQHALTVVLIAGSIMAGVATVVLIFAFRAFGGAKAGKSTHMGLIAALVVFVFVCCALLFAVSYMGD